MPILRFQTVLLVANQTRVNESLHMKASHSRLVRIWIVAAFLFSVEGHASECAKEGEDWNTRPPATMCCKGEAPF